MNQPMLGFDLPLVLLEALSYSLVLKDIERWRLHHARDPEYDGAYEARRLRLNDNSELMPRKMTDPIPRRTQESLDILFSTNR